MKTEPAKLRDVLLQHDYLTAGDLDRAEAVAKKKNTPLVDYLLSEGILTRDLLGQAVAESFGIGYADFHHHPPGAEQILRIPEKTAVKYQAVLKEESAESVTVATADPSDRAAVAKLQEIFRPKKLKLEYEFPEAISNLFIYYRKPLETRFIRIIESQKKVAPEIIFQVLEDALDYRASDVHFEPRAEAVVVRFRIDGVLQDVGKIPKEQYENILNLVKVQAHLRIDEHLSAQDGSIRYLFGEEAVDLRISITPTLEGERLAIRILSKYVRDFSFRELGLSVENQEIFSAAAGKPFGMVLVTGPTGSGKTTTLYALVKTLNRPEVNIVTIEDPVEYRISGVSQIQVNLQTNLNFSAGLRSIIRQDPNIILVGEIRDRETAEIAVNAALTGHLLLSSFHANDAATAIPRLLDMGVEPFLLSSTLELIVAQRLVRKICQNCRYSLSTGGYKGKGCDVCHGTGYQGRTAIFELIPVTTELRELILKDPSAGQIWKLVTEQGARSMFEDGLDKVENGVTTLEELRRVAPAG